MWSVMDRNLFTIGDNGFYQDRKTLALYRKILETPGVDHPRVCLVPTASGDAAFIIEAFQEVFGGLGARTSVLSLFRGDREDLEALRRKMAWPFTSKTSSFRKHVAPMKAEGPSVYGTTGSSSWRRRSRSGP
jgi:hypothetical protein